MENNYITKFTNRFNDFAKSNLFKALGVFGLFVISKTILKSLLWVKKYFLSFERDFKKLYGDGWVIITGGSEGIGKSLAEEFAKRGFKILLISRTEETLKKTSDELSKIQGANQIEYLAFDFSQDYDKTTIDELRKKMSPYHDCSILINNVGMTQNSLFNNMSDDYIRKMINTNVNSLVWMTRIVIDGMLKRNDRSLIVGSGSVAHYLRVKFKSIYVASKTFMDGFMCSLARETDRIDYTYMEIGPISTKLNMNSYPGQLSSPKPFAQSAMTHLGKYFYSGIWWRHGLTNDLAMSNDCLLEYEKRNAESSIKEREN